MTKKVHILKDDFGTQITAVGFVSHGSILSLSIELNNLLGSDFKLSAPITAPKTQYKFPCCMHSSDDESNQYYLIRNKHNGRVLFNYYKQLDYLLVFSALATESNSSNIQLLKSSENISLVLELEIGNIKGISNLLPN